MQSSLIIKDLSAGHALDRQAMTAVLGGNADQANGTSQSNVQQMAAVANIGNGSGFCGPTTIQSDNTFTQTASNHSEALNFKGLSIAPWDCGPVAC